jgi:hypothetical protein
MVNVAYPVLPEPLVAESVAVYIPLTVGTPIITPVVVLILNPGGKTGAP